MNTEPMEQKQNVQGMQRGRRKGKESGLEINR